MCMFLIRQLQSRAVTSPYHFILYFVTLFIPITNKRRNPWVLCSPPVLTVKMPVCIFKHLYIKTINWYNLVLLMSFCIIEWHLKFWLLLIQCITKYRMRTNNIFHIYYDIQGITTSLVYKCCMLYIKIIWIAQLAIKVKDLVYIQGERI